MSTKYTIKSDELADGVYVFRVRAKANGYASSELSNDVTFIKETVQVQLSTPVGLSVSNKILKWTAVTNAISYYVNIDGADFSSVTNSYSLGGLVTAKTYSIKVKAIADGVIYANSEYSAIYTYTVVPSLPKLATPTGLRVNGNYMYWNSVPNSIYYYAEIDYYDNVAYSTSYLLPTAPGTYLLRVRAISDGTNYANSDYSEGINYTVEMPEEYISPPSIDTDTLRVFLEDYYVWQGLFSFLNPNALTVNIEYGYDWDSFPYSYNYSFNNVGFYGTTPEAGILNDSEKVRTLYINARIEYQGRYSDPVYAYVTVQPREW